MNNTSETYQNVYTPWDPHSLLSGQVEKNKSRQIWANMLHIYDTISHQIKCHNFGLTEVNIVTDKSIQTIIPNNLVKLNSIFQGKVEVSVPYVYNRLISYLINSQNIGKTEVWTSSKSKQEILSSLKKISLRQNRAGTTY